MKDSEFTEWAIFILILGVVVSIGAVILTNYGDAVGGSASNSDSLVYIQPQGIGTVDRGVTSFSATRLNQTWLDFDGINDYVQAENTDTNIFGYDQRTISMWFYANNDSVLQTYFSHPQSATNNRIYLRVGANGNLIGLIGQSSYDILNTGNWDLNQWNHLAIDIDYVNNNTKNYYNGEYVKDNGFVWGTPVNVDLKIGSISTSAEFFNGSIDDIRIYNESLSAGEIQGIFLEGRK